MRNGPWGMSSMGTTLLRVMKHYDAVIGDRLILYVYFVYIYVYILPACVSVGHVQAVPRRSEGGGITIISNHVDAAN